MNKVEKISEQGVKVFVDLPAKSLSFMNFSYYGHACFGVEIEGIHLLFDPFIKPNPLAASIDISAIKADYILVSHGHGDHISDVEEIARKNNSVLISGYEIVSWFGTKGITNAVGMNLGGWYNSEKFRVKYVNAVHSSVLPDGSYGGNPGGFVIESAEGNFYYAGDTALTMDMQLIPLTCKTLDFAVLPIGNHFTMGYEDAFMAAEWLRVERVVGVHYQTFPPITIDTEAACHYWESKGKELLLPQIGSTINI